ncbi:MAG TPA: NAD(P)-binding protein [Burkholderiales bacterium]|nr:NAD(P)-binding protein [Burkholderiales bacterium]
MAIRILETDYLVVGCGASGMAFADALVSTSDADIVMLDRRHAPGGHWNDAYPFVRLHQPSLMYGVNSTPLGTDAIDCDGPNKGFYYRSGGTEIVAYYDRVMRERLLASGRVRFFPMCDYAGGGRFTSRLAGDAYEVKARKAIVDATYLEGKVPATTPPPFEVAPGARCVPVGELARLASRAERYAIVGGGKTGIDACLWLLENGVAPSDIRWIRPRELWLLNRVFFQGGDLVGTAYEGLSLQAEAAAQAGSMDELFARLAASEQMLRIDEGSVPTMYRGATVSADELAQLRRIEDVVHLGHVRRIERDRIVLEGGTVPTSPETLHLHCAAAGLSTAPAVPVFADGRITLQALQPGFLPFSAAFIAFIEATRRDGAEKNRLCPSLRLQNVPRDWAAGMLVATQTAYLWTQAPDVQQWLEGARLWWLRGLRRFFGEPRVQQAHKRYTENVRPATANLARLLTDSTARS